MAKLAGKSGDVYVATAIIDDCEDAWVSGTHGTASLNTTAAYVKVGSGSCKIVTSSLVAEDVIGYEPISAGATNYAGYTHAYCWAYCTGTTVANDLVLVLDSVNELPDGSSETEMNFPALTASTWKYCRLTNVTGKEIEDSTAALVVGVQWNANAQDKTLYLDDIRAAKVIAGINSWNLDYTADALETTDFVNGGVRAYIVGASGWTGSFSGYKDGAPLSIGTQYGIDLAASATATQAWSGTIYITAVHPSVSFDGVVSYSYDFQGTGSLQVASA